MVKLVGNDIYRSGEKIGWIEEEKIFAHDGTKLGYFEGNDVYDREARKTAYVDGDFLYAESGNTKIPLEKISENVMDGVIPEIARAAIYVLLGN